eukprot:UN01165
MAQQHLQVEDELKKSDSISSIVSNNDGASADAIPFSLNVKHTIAKLKLEKSRKIMIAMDNSEFSQKAVNFVNNNLARKTDAILLISVWEEAMINKLVDELDCEIIHPQKNSGHSKHAQLHNTFNQATCLKHHSKFNSIVGGIRIQSKYQNNW